jgi:EAL domain-containing protein (putative c-di-GMP-specific phosphodiesterase class I)/GGDEF domain-containing protein
MEPKTIDLADHAFFPIQVRQAIHAAQHSTRQVGILLIGFSMPRKRGVRNVDGFGSAFSDEIWIRLRGILRDSDPIVQMDDSTFGVLLLSISGVDDVVRVAKKIIGKLQKPLSLQRSKLAARARMGIALFPQHATTAENLIEGAGLALAEAKRTRKSYIIYSQEYRAERPALRMGELRQAITAGELFLLFQPKIDLETGLVSGLEALTRWQHPTFGLISPDEFIPVAERTGLIIPLTLWVLHQSLLQCRDWQRLGFEVNVSVNLSMWNLEAQELPDQLEGLLTRIGVAPEKLELEITESAIMVDPQRVMHTLMRIKDLGVKFAIDDFGTGYSSLAYLKKLPVSGMKIDKSFVLNMEVDRDNAVIVRSIIDLGHNLGLKVVAEGVETAEANEMLKSFQCDEAQGFYYSRPVPAYAITDFLTASSAPPRGSELRDSHIRLPRQASGNGKSFPGKMLDES